MLPYDSESIVLGIVLTYGDRAAQLVLPDLSPDRFIFGFDSRFGADHREVWQSIADTFLIKHQSPTLVNVAANSHNITELSALVDRLTYQYHITDFNVMQFETLCDLVDKAGIVYHTAQHADRLANLTSDPDALAQTVASITDVDQWLTQHLNETRQLMTRRSTGYNHIRNIVQEVKQGWQELFTGKKSVLLETGFPTLKKHKLFPKGKLTVLHGLPGSGKSSFAFQMALGVAIDLFQRGEKGCVAINSLEMEQIDLVEKLASIMAQIDVTKLINQTMTKDELDRLTYWADYVAQLPIFVDPTNFITTSAMEYRASGLHVSEHGPVHMIVSDYGELFADVGASKEQQVDAIFRNQFRLSRAIGAAVMAISQSTIDRSVSARSYIAGPDGTRYSKAIHMATDVQVEMYNPPAILASGRQDLIVPQNMSTDHAYLLVQKYRKGATNSIIDLLWRPNSTTFLDMDLNFGVTPNREIIFSHFNNPQTVQPVVAGSTW